jgi:hypothetical protein
MPTPTTFRIPSPIAPIATPEVVLPCGIKVPSIPLIPDLSLTITLPPFPPIKLKKKGPRKSRLDKYIALMNRLKKLCNGDCPKPRPVT